MRGNVDTRLRKLADGEYDTVVLALAGLRRLGRDDGSHPLSWDEFVPAPGQGLLALETRAADRDAAAVTALEDPSARRRLEAERAVVEELDASCHTPVGAHARVDAERIAVHAFVGLPDGKEWITDRLEGSADDPRAAGRELARRLLAAGAGELLRRAQAVG
jgi:hydroxymethylbilane synthase